MSDLLDQVIDTVAGIEQALARALDRAQEQERRCQDLEAELGAADDDLTRSRLMQQRCDAGLELAYIASTLRGAMAGVALAAELERPPRRRAA